MLVCLIIAAAIALCAATGMICWQIRDRQAQAEVEETKLTHMENFNYSRTNAYRWVTEAGTARWWICMRMWCSTATP